MRKLNFAGESNCGLIRVRNEDSFVYAADGNGMPSLAVVADGLGGHRDGDIASFFCCRELLTAWSAVRCAVDDRKTASEFLANGIAGINRELYQASRRRRRAGQLMGTTIVSAVFLADEVVVCHAGDSRFYRFADHSGLVQVTCDHTLQRKMEENGRKPGVFGDCEGIISKAVGTREEIEPEFNFVAREEDAKYLMCTDGLSRSVDFEYLDIAVGSGVSPQDSVDRLMRSALIAGGMDNITHICIYEN